MKDNNKEIGECKSNNLSVEKEDRLYEFYVAPYALDNVIRALTNDGFHEIYVTKVDNNLMVRYNSDSKIYKKVVTNLKSIN